MDLAEAEFHLPRRDDDQRLEPVRIRAAERVHVAVLGADELGLDLQIGVAVSAAVDDGVDVGAFFVHVLEAYGAVIVATAVGGEARTHERLELAFLVGSRAGFTEAARWARAPAACFAASAQAVVVLQWLLIALTGHANATRRPVLVGRKTVAHFGGKELGECLGGWANVRVRIPDLIAVFHVRVLSSSILAYCLAVSLIQSYATRSDYFCSQTLGMLKLYCCQLSE